MMQTILIIDDDAAIGNLRGKLRSASGHDYAEAVWGIGFRLRAES